MSFGRSTFLTKHTAVGSTTLAIASLGFLGCGGTGERLKADTTVSTDAGLVVDPCNLSASLETQYFGCTPVPQKVFCLDMEQPAVTDGFVYQDTISFQLLGADEAWTDPADGKIQKYYAIPMGENHCGDGSYALHFTAHNQLVWGPQFGQQYALGTISGDLLAPVDVSDWEGIAFWIKQGTDRPDLEPTGTTLFVSLRDPNTMSRGDQGGTRCDDKSNIDSEKCDPYGAAVGFDTTWRYVMIPFDDLKQRGYGVREEALDRTHIMKLTFSMDIGDAANGNWNLWVDNVVQYRRKH